VGALAGFEWGASSVAVRRGWRAWAWPLLKGLVGAAVLVAVGRQVWKAGLELAARQDALRLDPGWLAGSIPLYLAGLSAFGLYFGRLMGFAPEPIRATPALRAYLISHLGKYVPGKALVVVMRSALCAESGARAATAAFATLYETLVMMAAGGLVATLGFAVSPAREVQLAAGPLGVVRVPLWLPALGAGVAFLVVVEVRIFRRLSRLASLPFRGVGPEALPPLSARLLGEGLVWAALGWTLLGLSQVAVIEAIVPEGLGLSWWPAVIASVALATVAGFVVPVAPGGLGVREWVLWTGLGSALDHDRAVVSALVLRLVWVAGELLAAGFVYPLSRKRAVQA
jgi:uncharacterized membrane protein YbhN (UPF0104 family)